MLRSSSLVWILVPALLLAGAVAGAEPGDLREVQKLIEAYEKGWNTLSVELLEGIWDQEYKPIIYLAAEHDKPFTDWESVRAYYEAAPEALSDAKMHVLLEGLSINVLGDFAYAFFPFEFSATLKKTQRHIEAEGHVTMVLRKGGGAWRVVHYHESCPLATTGQE